MSENIVRAKDDQKVLACHFFFFYGSWGIKQKNTDTTTCLLNANVNVNQGHRSSLKGRTPLQTVCPNYAPRSHISTLQQQSLLWPSDNTLSVDGCRSLNNNNNNTHTLAEMIICTIKRLFIHTFTPTYSAATPSRSWDHLFFPTALHNVELPSP